MQNNEAGFPLLILHTQKSKWKPYLSIELEKLKLQDENIRKYSLRYWQGKGKGKDFLQRTPVAEKIVSRINKQDHIKFKSSYSKGNQYNGEETALCRMEKKKTLSAPSEFSYLYFLHFKMKFELLEKM